MRYCLYCGAEMPSDACFCGKCGKEQSLDNGISNTKMTHNADAVFEARPVTTVESVENKLKLNRDGVTKLLECCCFLGFFIMIGTYLFTCLTPINSLKAYYIYNLFCISILLIIISVALMMIRKLKRKSALGLTAEGNNLLSNLGIGVVAVMAIGIVAIVILYQVSLYNIYN